MPADAPVLRPTAAETSAAPMETGSEQQIEHLIDGGETLAKVFPAGEPLVATCWTCPTCGLSVRGAPPRRCMSFPAPPVCPVEPTP